MRACGECKAESMISCVGSVLSPAMAAKLAATLHRRELPIRRLEFGNGERNAMGDGTHRLLRPRRMRGLGHAPPQRRVECESGVARRQYGLTVAREQRAPVGGCLDCLRCRRLDPAICRQSAAKRLIDHLGVQPSDDSPSCLDAPGRGSPVPKWLALVPRSLHQVRVCSRLAAVSKAFPTRRDDLCERPVPAALCCRRP